MHYDMEKKNNGIFRSDFTGSLYGSANRNKGSCDEMWELGYPRGRGFLVTGSLLFRSNEAYKKMVDK